MIHVGDCTEVMPRLEAARFDAIVTDPPYHLTTASRGGHARTNNPEMPHGRHRIGDRGFMGKVWDGGDVAFRPETWAAALRLAKPGAYLLAFGGTRTYHRLTCAIEDGGWEISDCLAWLYGSGFPKSFNGPWGGTALKPAFEPIVMARAPFRGTVERNWREHGTGALNIEACRIETRDDLNGGAYSAERKPSSSEWVARGGTIHSSTGREFEQPEGRWPANVMHDGSPEVVAAFPAKAGGQGRASGPTLTGENTSVARGKFNGLDRPATFHGDNGSAAGFFYCAKVDAAERHDGLDEPGPQFQMGSRPCDAEAVNAERRGNYHPTVKPTELMRWLVRLVTPAGGLVFDPFTGSGSTGRAAIAEGMRFEGIELDPDHVRIAEARIRAMQPGLSLAMPA